MNKETHEINRRWPWNSYDEEEDMIVPYDELEDVKHKDDDYNDW